MVQGRTAPFTFDRTRRPESGLREVRTQPTPGRCLTCGNSLGMRSQPYSADRSPSKDRRLAIVGVGASPNTSDQPGSYERVTSEWSYHPRPRPHGCLGVPLPHAIGSRALFRRAQVEGNGGKVSSGVPRDSVRNLPTALLGFGEPVCWDSVRPRAWVRISRFLRSRGGRVGG